MHDYQQLQAGNADCPALSVLSQAEAVMPDKLQGRGGQDRKRNDSNQEYRLRGWSRKLGVSPDQLKYAIWGIVPKPSTSLPSSER
jgi:hypothetical protein